MTKALVFEELKGRAIALDGIQSSIAEGSGLTIAIKPEDVAEKINNLGNKIEQEKKQRQSVAQKNAPALLGISGMYAGSNFPLTPDQPVILGRDSATAKSCSLREHKKSAVDTARSCLTARPSSIESQIFPAMAPM